MARIGLQIYVSGYTGKLLIVWKEVIAGNPTPPETGRSSAFDFPYSAEYSINNINPSVHLVELWRSADGSSLDELIKRWEIDASIYNVAKLVRYQYRVGRGNTEGTIGEGDYWIDPSENDTELIDERLDGAVQADLRVHEAGFGDWANDRYSVRTGGGINLLGSYVFNPGTDWFIEWQTILQVQAVVTTSAPYTGVEIITANRDFFVDVNDNLYNKLCIINGSAPVVEIPINDLSLIPNNTRVTFNTHQGSQNYLKLAFNTGDTINYLGQAKNVIYIPKCEVFTLYFKDGAVYFEKAPDRAIKRGKIEADMDSSRHTDTGAYLLADESAGELDKADYPGLYEFIENLPAGLSVPLGTGSGQWSQAVVVNSGKINEETTYPNKTKYGIDTVAEKFRVPHLRNMSRRFVNTGENPGRYQHDAVGSFEANVTVPKGHSYNSSPNNSRIGNGDATPEDKIIPMVIDTGNTENITRNFGETPYVVL